MALLSRSLAVWKPRPEMGRAIDTHAFPSSQGLVPLQSGTGRAIDRHAFPDSQGPGRRPIPTFFWKARLDGGARHLDLVITGSQCGGGDRRQGRRAAPAG